MNTVYCKKQIDVSCQSSLRIHFAIASWIHSYFDNVMTHHDQ